MMAPFFISCYIINNTKEVFIIYTFKSSMIGNIPILEFTPTDKMDQPLPLVIFYHGWTNTKEDSATEAIELVKRGFRVVLPDCLMHGDRYVHNTKVADELFFKVLLQNMTEFPAIINYYVERYLIKDDYIAVSGLSMGGITSAMLLTHHPEIKAASILMGTPKLLTYAKLLAQQYFENSQGTEEAANDETAAQLQKLGDYLAHFDLSLMPHKINQRPLLFWHAQGDPTIPHNLTEDFFEENFQQSYANHTHFVSDQAGKHKVTYLAAFRQAAFLEACYQNSTDHDIWQQTGQEIIHRFGNQSQDIFNYMAH